MKFFSSLAALAFIASSSVAQQLVPGVYRISSVSSPSNVLTSRFSNVQALAFDNGADQLWKLTPIPGRGVGNWSIQNIGTGKFAVANASGPPGVGTVVTGGNSAFTWFTLPEASAWRIHVNTQLAVTFNNDSMTGVALNRTTFIPGDSQAWRFDLIALSPGTYNIVNVASKTFLDLCGCTAGSATPVVSIEASGSASQKWKVSSVAGGFTVQNVGNGAYMLAPGSPVVGTAVVVDPTQPAFTWSIVNQGSFFTIATGFLAANLTFPNIQGVSTFLQPLLSPAPDAMLWRFAQVV